MKITKWIASVIFSIAVFFFCNQFDFFNKKGIENVLVSISKEINKNTPYQLDRFTILESTIAHENVLSYRMKIIGIDIEDKEIDFSKDKLFWSIRNALCSQQSTKKILAQGAIYKYIYSKDNGTYLFTITVDNKDCEDIRRMD